MPHDLTPSADTGGAAETDAISDEDFLRTAADALAGCAYPNMAAGLRCIADELASLHARLTESETKAAAMRDAIREHDYISRECPNRAERIASWNAVAASAGLTQPEPT